MTLFRWLAGTRRRLAIAALVCFGIVAAMSVPITRYVRETSTSGVTDMWLIVALIAVVCLGSWVVAVLIGDFIFPHRWRERVILGLDIDIEVDDSSLESLDATNSYLLRFSLVMVAVLAGTAWLIETFSGGFFAEYQRVGHFRSTMRGDETVYKLELVQARSFVRRPQLMEDALFELLDPLWKDTGQSEEVRIAAVRVMGQLFLSLQESLRHWRQEGEGFNHWEQEMMARIHAELLPEMRLERPAAASPMAATLLLALGKARDTDSLAAAHEILEDPTADPAVWHSAAAVIGLIADVKSTDRLLALAKKLEDVERFRDVGWAATEIGRQYEPHMDKVAPAEFDRLVDVYGEFARSGTVEQRCISAHVLNQSRYSKIAPAIFAAIADPGSHGYCEAWRIEVDQPGPRLVAEAGDLRLRILTGLQHIAMGDRTIYDWAIKYQNHPDYADVAPHLTSIASTWREEEPERDE